MSAGLKRDPTAASYTYHDDPYLIPFNARDQVMFAMAKEGGKKAARCEYT